MSQIINYQNKLSRICHTNNTKLEFSNNGGRTWNYRCFRNDIGRFVNLVVNGNDTIATTGKGFLIFSDNGCRTFIRRA